MDILNTNQHSEGCAKSYPIISKANELLLHYFNKLMAFRNKLKELTVNLNGLFHDFLWLQSNNGQEIY